MPKQSLDDQIAGEKDLRVRRKEKEREQDVGQPYRNRGRLSIAACFVGFLKTKWVKIPRPRRRRRKVQVLREQKIRTIDGDAISWHG